jgi:hypothetical protein
MNRDKLRNNVQKIYAVIQAQFSTGPGSAKVRSGESELSEPINGQHAIFKSNIELFPIRPGMSITMSIIIRQYAGSTRCPRAYCKSYLRKISLSSQIWTWLVYTYFLSCVDFWKDSNVENSAVCKISFKQSTKQLPGPLRPHFTLGLIPPIHSRHSSSSDPLPLSHRAAVIERKSYRHISIYTTELPPTPHHLKPQTATNISQRIHQSATTPSQRLRQRILHAT